MNTDIHPLQEPPNELIGEAFPWECPRRREAKGDEFEAHLSYYLDPEISIEVTLGENTADIALSDSFDRYELEESLPVEEWADFQGWMGMAAARYAEIRNGEPLELIAASNIFMQFGHTSDQGVAFRPGSTVSMRPHTNEVLTDFNGYQPVIAPDLAKQLREGKSLLPKEEWKDHPLSVRQTDDGIISTQFQHGNPKKRTPATRAWSDTKGQGRP